MNYLPFVRVVGATVPASPARSSIRIPATSLGPGRSILQDCLVSIFGAVNIYPPNDPNPLPSSQTRRSQILMRYGWEKRGFLTEDFHPAGSFVSGYRPMTPVWKFERPYRLDPGEALSATITAGGTYNLQTSPRESTPALVFNGVRVRDNQPKLLYATTQLLAYTGDVVSLTFNCDSDSSLLLYSVTLHDYYDYNAYTSGWAAAVPSSVQIFGPGGREWHHYESDFTLTAAQVRAVTSNWIDLPGDPIDLGGERGWVQESDEAFVIEFKQNSSEGDKYAFITLRGVLERSNE